jgi:hypothetical protein
MKVAIDVHGTIDRWPVFWIRAINLMNAMGIKVYILSGPEKEKIVGRLLALKVDTTKLAGILSVADWIKDQEGAVFWYDDNGGFWADDKTWNEAKAYICAVNMIEVLIDDQIEYFYPDIAPHTLFILFNGLLGFERIIDESSKPSGVDSTG